MTTIKIISDPYKRNVEFEILNDTANEWERINYQNNPDSRLITETIRKSFFPYKVNDILNILQEEYSSDGSDIQILFEGTADEYLELQEASQDLQNISVQRSEIGIENARDILPQIIEIFTEVQPIVEESISSESTRRDIERDISKFIDASNDTIPICVLGNYSSGKSTFINALTGLEILPSGDMAVTAKIYKIKESDEDEKATIDFRFMDKAINVIVSGNGYSVDCDEDNSVVSDIKKVLEENSDGSLAEKINRCLEVVNQQKEGVTDLIEIQIPFVEGKLKGSNHSFVIFDTPGSNSATHKDHYSILEDAMKNMSNGIPVYISEYSQLDTLDNDNLYDKIKNISQIDSRFTMIVVNKADSANIKMPDSSESLEDTILNQAVPRNLYSGGIYFVSSIMGLGSKNDGSFIDDHMEEFFEDNEIKYSDPTSKRYKTLYRHNIMPRQIKQRIVTVSETDENKVLANSGLLAIEHEIVNFAEQYSAYDKCVQSNKYIEKIIQATQEEISKSKSEREANKRALKSELEEDKRALITSVEMKSNILAKGYKDAYNENLDEYHKRAKFSYTNDEIKKMEQKLLSDNREEYDFDGKRDVARESREAVFDNLLSIGKKSLGELVRDMGDDIKEAIDNEQELRRTKIRTDRETADELIELITDDFNERLDSSIKMVAAASRKYWEQNAEKVKEEQLMIVAKSKTLDEEKKEELAKVITSYGPVKFKDDQEFEKEEFEEKIHFLWVTIDLNRINTKKLTEHYNARFDSKIGLATGMIREKHGKSFDGWCERLVNKITDNIVNYSPKLSEQQKKIDEETQKIEQLENTKDTLEKYSRQVRKLMDWEALI